MPLKIATRGSALALTQANMVADALQQPFEIITIKTTGDIKAEASLKKIGGKEVFTKELDEALLSGSADIAVHSLKDVPGFIHDELEIIAVLPRADARDMLIGANSFDDIPEGAIFGTSSPRRMAQVLSKRPDLKLVEFRGNVETRIKKIENMVAYASLLANAGITRLGIEIPLPHALIPVTDFIPAVGQGIICIMGKKGKLDLSRINHVPSFTAATAERAVLKAFGGNCYTPLSAHAIITDKVTINGFVASDNGRQTHVESIEGNLSDAADLGCELGKRLLYKYNDLNNKAG